jgi:hypothetical protein
VEGFERYGDASSGPLQVGDRGIVVDLQRGPNGEKYVMVYLILKRTVNYFYPNLFHFYLDNLYVYFIVGDDGGTMYKQLSRKNQV